MRFKLTAILVLGAIFAATARAQNCTPGRDLISIPEIKSENGRLQGTIILSDEQRALAGNATGATCNWQHLRFFKGFSAAQPNKPWPATGDIIPGPTLRARVGDLIELTFLNQVDPRNFPGTLDQGGEGATPGCDIATATRQNGGASVQIYPRQSGPPWTTPPWGGSPGDTYPNCLHGSSTVNIHFHGTHTTPSTTGDNVLLFIRPALRDTGWIEPEDRFVHEQFADYFKWCEKNGPAQKWEQLPLNWQETQKQLLQHYDQTAPYKGVPGALPPEMQLWPRNAEELHKGLWPQYSIGASPYCFRLPEYDPAKVKMGQAPGTHWYHAHKHGSTALNVGNGMTGAFIIEGAYDDTLKDFYKDTPQHKNWGLGQQVLVIQQLETALNLLGPTKQTGPPPLSVNGRLNPVVTMKPNQVQLWRIINGAARNFVEFDSFTKHGPGGMSIAWRQIAQDGVQFAYQNYQTVGRIDAKFNLAAANRADLLVRAPSQEGDYDLQVVEGVSDIPSGTPVTLLTVRVRAAGNPIDPPMDFIQDEKDFPKFPAFLADINGPFHPRHELVFNTEPNSARQGKGYLPRHTINGKLFQDHVIDQTMTLNTMEEWKLTNRTTNIAHPFHIHINPFQIVEVFQANSPEAKDPTSKCYADPNKPETWKPCHQLPAPWVWWDTFAIPTGQQIDITKQCTNQGQTKLDFCPQQLRPYTECSTESGATSCTEFIAGYFKMRTRFADFTGEYVLHCHILAHEDRGMMELVAVVEKGVEKKTSDYSHH